MGTRLVIKCLAMPDIEYDYAQVPTVWRFSQAHKFIRGLMGPFGSGKSSACVMEVVQWATLDTRAETPRTRRAIHRASSPMSRACAERKLRQAEASMQLTTVCAAGSAAHANAINSAPVDDVQENRAPGGPGGITRRNHTQVLAQNAFYYGACGVLQSLARLLERGDVEEMHRVIERHGRRISAVRKLPPLRH